MAKRRQTFERAARKRKAAQRARADEKRLGTEEQAERQTKPKPAAQQEQEAE